MSIDIPFKDAENVLSHVGAGKKLPVLKKPEFHYPSSGKILMILETDEEILAVEMTVADFNQLNVDLRRFEDRYARFWTT